MVRGRARRDSAPMTSTPSSTNTVRRITRSRDDKMLAGVCGGIARHFGVDPVLVRIATVVLATMGGAGIVAYAAAWLLVPDEEIADAAEADPAPASTPTPVAA
jgi:phage shock protein PspC (stress-responsive transcriptional regulator)